jgi:hypothetical protein
LFLADMPRSGTLFLADRLRIDTLFLDNWPEAILCS